MKLMQRYYFEEEAPTLEKVCQRIKDQYDGAVEFECHSHRSEWDKEDYESSTEEQKMKKFHSDLMGISKWPVTVYWCVLNCGGEEVGLHSYTCKQLHIDLESHHTTKTHHLFEFAGEVLQEFGGKAREVSEEELKGYRRATYMSYSLFLLMIGFLSVLYFGFGLSILQIILILLIIAVVKFIFRIVWAYRAGKKRGWL